MTSQVQDHVMDLLFLHGGHMHVLYVHAHTKLHSYPTHMYYVSLQAVDIRHIADKFPEKNGGLKDLFDKGPQDRFFLVKFWVSRDIPPPLLVMS